MRAARLGLVALLLVAACGGDETATPPPATAATIAVTSPAFADGDTIPEAHTCRGDGGSPELAWQGVPADATSVALVVSDPDAPGGTFIHWVLYDLPPGDGGLTAGEVPAGAQQGEGWTAPCPPSGTHHYLFTVYALREKATGSSTQELLDDIGRKTVGSGVLTGVVSSD